MIAVMQSTLPYVDAEELFRLVPLAEALDSLRTCFAAAPSHVDRVQITEPAVESSWSCRQPQATPPE